MKAKLSLILSLNRNNIKENVNNFGLADSNVKIVKSWAFSRWSVSLKHPQMEGEVSLNGVSR